MAEQSHADTILRIEGLTPKQAEAVEELLAEKRRLTAERDGAMKAVAEALLKNQRLQEERNEAFDSVGIPREASLSDLIRHHRNNEAAAQGAWKIAAEEWQKRAVPAEAENQRLRDALEQIATGSRKGQYIEEWDGYSIRLPKVVEIAREALAGDTE